MIHTVHRQTRRFLAAAISAALFFIFSSVAMLVYPGGTATDHHHHGYSFFSNFFSDLGRTRSFSDQPNIPSMMLFLFSMACAGSSLVLFFITFTTCLTTRRRSLHLSRFGAVLGIGSALCFVGVAVTPWDLLLLPHMTFMVWAFRLFLGAVVLNLLAVLFTPGLPHRFAWIFVTFALLLLGYLILLITGPSMNTSTGLMVQAVSQKVIAYSAVITVLAQSLIMRQHLLRTHKI